METAIRWSPWSTTAEQRFLYVDVAGKSFRLCRVTEFNGRDLDYEVLSTHSKVPAFRAFDWSPADESLIAVGQSSGEATILRMLGDSQESLSFPIRNQRYCNAVAFSTHGLLAAGLDKVRNDFCLNIWDVNQRLSAVNSRGTGVNRHAAEPLRKLASSEPITSIKFFRDQPDTLVTGVKGQFGIGNPSLQFPTRCVHNLAIDWLDENYIASCYTSNEPTICVWDRRAGSRFVSVPSAPGATEQNQLGSALDFKNVLDRDSTIWSMRFSRTKRGCLGVLSNKGHFKAYDIAKEYMSEGQSANLDQTLGQGSSRDYLEPIYTKYVRDIRSPYNHPTRGCSESERVVSFDFLNISSSNQPSAITLAGNGNVHIATLQPPCPPVRLSSQGVLVRGGSSGNADFDAMYPCSGADRKISDVVSAIRDRALPGSGEQPVSNGTLDSLSREDGVQPLSSRENREHSLSVGTLGTPLEVGDALTLMTVSRFRCKEGYLFDGTKNKDILADDINLQDFWDWIERSREHTTGDSMIVNGIDMNYLGVYNIWNNDLGTSLNSRKVSPVTSEEIDIGETIVELARQLQLPEIKGCRSEFLEHRQLCLHICGAAESENDLEDTVKQLLSEKQHTKAAALAVFQDEAKLAYLALRNNQPTQAHKLLAMAIAGAAKGEADSDWEETCAEIAKELTDPYARAILALVSKGDWNSVIQETTLPLRYRVEVALRWLPDDDLTLYLRDATAEAIQRGDIEGIVLTGLTNSAMELFQSYINKFNDVQTSVLAMSHTVPRFIDDETMVARFNAWRETYRWQMNSWKLQLERARFDVGSRKFAVTWDGRRLVSPPKQQVSLTCNYCTRPLAQSIPSKSSAEVVHPTAGNPLGSNSLSGTICPRCGRHMPRCGVCTLWLGSPDPMTRACIVADAAQGDQKRTEEDIMRRFAVFCINCNHGFHAHHARDWFSRHKICPVAECNCICDR
ncbi:conserved hypothetical protein [Paecilomyces variotii No. 5]|uniref:Uncharacterized protein n=1 Tax=Byssochlamys spectabilis (strain No. 5 / NBRC 109023) TaxID=1356009 RepID=V5G0B3_BYSSN|nr:conserved hypothetical protein [Paecilomyces variotii No. 5]